MSYNIHPIFVHFPIAFLFTYSIIKVFPFRRWFPDISWKHIERVLLIVGVLGAFAALLTGENAESLYRSERELVGFHSFFAEFATWMYGILLFGEAISFFNETIILNIPSELSRGKRLLVLVDRIINNSFVSKILVIFGLLAISLTGLLGGAIVYGTSADPFAKFVLQLLGIN
jgi:uncharacterized membrane protein